VSHLHGPNAQRAIGARLQREEHASPEHGLAHVRARVVRDAAHHVESRGHPNNPHLATVEVPGQAGQITRRLAQQLLESLDFERQLVAPA
jgi:hypothetical protein